ncbi:MAG: hypothetical protein ABWY00_08500 [Dongiaceae bacterium]
MSDPAHLDFVKPRLVNQPWRTVYQPVKALKQWPDMPIAYIRCTAYTPSVFEFFLGEMKKNPKIRTDTIDAGHSCMLTQPAETTRLLLKYSA